MLSKRRLAMRNENPWKKSRSVRRRIPVKPDDVAMSPESLRLVQAMILTAQVPTMTPDLLPGLDKRLDERQQSGGCLVIVFDNNKNTWDEVVLILQKATGCDLEEAEMETWEVDNLGKSVVHHAGKEDCERAAEIIRTIGIRVEVVED